MGQGSGKDGKGGPGGPVPSDFGLWKAFVRDVTPLKAGARDDKADLGKPVNPPPRIPATEIEKSSPKLNPPAQPPQLDMRTERRLKQGKISIDGTLDLHGYSQDKAHRVLNEFVLNAYAADKRCLLVITGKGRGTEEGVGVLKQKLPGWLSMPPLQDKVLKSLPAAPKHGGGGAWYVYLKRQRPV